MIQCIIIIYNYLDDELFPFFFVVERQLQQTSLKEWVSRKKSSGSTEVSFF